MATMSATVWHVVDSIDNYIALCYELLANPAVNEVFACHTQLSSAQFLQLEAARFKLQLIRQRERGVSHCLLP